MPTQKQLPGYIPMNGVNPENKGKLRIVFQRQNAFGMDMSSIETLHGVRAKNVQRVLGRRNCLNVKTAFMTFGRRRKNEQLKTIQVFSQN